ncbi:PulJ/GspJ family protein [Flavobacterium sp. 3HN19-14]|uniref:PulJ/GspJ family protein n=1 Tax=Flavobacterium sp. 3HN19-14 TaxID=3448133 RepID=UPI003EE256C2
MTKKSYTSAFSVLEAVVSMVISAIIIGLVFLIFSIISERMQDYRQQNETISDLNRLAYCLNKDVFENSRIEIQDSTIIFYSYSGNATRYQLRDRYMLKDRGEFSDTFHFPVRSLRLDTIHNKKMTSAFQRLRLGIELNSGSRELKFFRKIYANELIETIKVQ